MTFDDLTDTGGNIAINANFENEGRYNINFYCDGALNQTISAVEVNS